MYNKDHDSGFGLGRSETLSANAVPPQTPLHSAHFNFQWGRDLARWKVSWRLQSQQIEGVYSV
jgi:hypothetical protein